MSPAVRSWRTLRVLLGAAGLALLSFVLAPSSAEADDSASPLTALTSGVTELVSAPVKEKVAPATTSVTTAVTTATTSATKAGTKAVTATVGTTTDVVDEVVAATPVAPDLEPVTKPVTSTVDRTTTTVTTTVDTVVDTATGRVDDTVEDTVGAVTEVLEAVVGPDDPVVAPGDGTIVDPVDAVPPATAAVDRGAERAVGPTADSAVATTGPSTGALDVWTATTAAVVEIASPRASTAVAWTADALDAGFPAPSQPLPYLVSALLAGAAVVSFSGRGPLGSADGVTAGRIVLPVPMSASPRAALVPVVTGPALRPGSRPD